MPPQLSKSAHSVQAALDKLMLECKVLELPNSTRTALDAASAIGCDIAQIVKSLVFRTKKTARPVLILASGPNRVDIQSLANYLGENIEKADAKFVKEVTGFAIGGIPPIGHKNPIDFIYIDKDLLKFDEVWAAAGTPNGVFCIKSQDLLKATGGQLINIKEEK